MVSVENIYDVNPDGSEGLLAVIARDNGPAFKNNMDFITPQDEQLQVYEVTMDTGRVIEPHIHRLIERRSVGTPEVLIIKSGRIQLDIYTSSGRYVSSHDLVRGDIAVLLRGGHGVTAIRYSEILEVKQGPYAGSRKLDKDDTWKPQQRD